MSFIFSSCLPNWNTSTGAPVLRSCVRFASKALQRSSALGLLVFFCSHCVQEPTESRRPMLMPMDVWPETGSLGTRLITGVEVSAGVVGWVFTVCSKAGKWWLTCSTILFMASCTKPVITTWLLCLSAARSSKRAVAWPSARRATFRIRTFRHSGACVMPSDMQSAGEVVAFTTSVSAAIPLTKKSILSPSWSFRFPLARSCLTRIARARPTMPRRPPQVMTQMSARLTVEPARSRSGFRISSMTKRSTFIRTYIRTVHK
mmetsp:Transcript_93147/g.290396  ORF Transcript_93147/g.290396 Transcript_93147/m.290396 type:complete len:260 (+) Transcript_93147:1112-1891(+)